MVLKLLLGLGNKVLTNVKVHLFYLLSFLEILNSPIVMNIT